MSLISEFEKFLEEEGVLEEYCNEVKAEYEMSVKDLLKVTKPELYVTGAFRWDLSPSGHDKWSQISEKWDNKLEKMKEKGNDGDN